MKSKTFVILMFSVLISYFSFGQIACNHRSSFAKSPLSDSLDVLSYHIYIDSIHWDSDELFAQTQVVLKSKIDELNIIPLELMSLTVDHIFYDGTETTAFEQIANRLLITPEDPLQTDETITLLIQYHGVPFHESWGGFYIDNQYAYNLGVGFDADPHNLGKSWFPCVDDFTDRAIYDVTARVSDPLIAVAGGLLIDVVDNGDGTKSYHWALNNSIPTYLASVAIGDYQVYEDVFQGQDAEIPIKIYVHPNSLTQVEPTFTHLKEILSTYESHFGSYPFNRIGYVGTSIGAMEHATNIAYPNFAIDGSLDYEYLYAHELSHMWFGDEVTCASAEDMWLNEGWATFCQIFYKNDLYGTAVYKQEMEHQLREVLKTTHYTDNGYWALYGIPHDITYGSTVYDKGSTVVQSIRGYLGDDIFFPAMQAYLTNYAYQPASSENLRDFLSNYTGIDMTDFFDAYVFTPGFSQFSVDSIAAEDDSHYRIYMKQRLKGKDVFANSNKVDVTLMDDSWNSQTVQVHFNGQTGDGAEVYDLAFVPTTAMVDLEQNFGDAATDEAKVITEPGTYHFPECYFKLEVEEVPDSSFFRVVHNWVAPDSLWEAVEGLRLSDYRYYSIEGILPASMQAAGLFHYSISEKIDPNLLGNPLDSLVMLYRPDASQNWSSIPFEREGSPFIGDIRVPDIKKGDYTFAIWDEQFVKVKESVPMSGDDYLNCYPNPSSGRFYFELYLPKDAQLNIYDSSGKILDSIALKAHASNAKWDGRRMPSGTYLVKLQDKEGKSLAEKKLIIK
jgi:aminopeptidase N